MFNLNKRSLIVYQNGQVLALLLLLSLCHQTLQQQNRRAQSSGGQSAPSPPNVSNSNNQALRVSSQQRSAAATQSQPVSTSQSQQAARKLSQSAPKKSLDPDAENEEAGQADVKFECPRPDGLFADPYYKLASCKKFILCGSSHPWQQTCPPGLYFDSKLKFCTFKTSTLTCGPISDEEEVKQDEATQDAQDSLPTCDNKCQLPDCFCSADGTAIPGNLQPNQVPQMVLISFSGAVNELVFDHYKKILGYSNKFGSGQTRLNPNGCGIKATFFVSHEYTSYAQVHWLAAQSHEIALHSISHRLPELWWTDKANYSDWVEEMIGMREITLQLTNINGDSPVIKREDIVGMRAPYIKPGGDNMYQMINDFGLQYSSSIVAPKADYPLWPFTLDSKVPFDCANVRSNKQKQHESHTSTSQSGHEPGQRQRRNAKSSDEDEDILKHSRNEASQASHSSNSGELQRSKRQSTFAGKSLKCPTKSYPAIWEIPLNPLTNEISTCHHLDQCVFPSQDDHSDSSDIVNFLVENFERHYNTTRAPFQINLHVQWVLNNNRVKALTKFIDHVSKAYPNVWFVSFKQMLDWVRSPSAANLATNTFKCDEPGKVKLTSCNRPQTCVVKLNTNIDNHATVQEQSSKSEARYLQICPGVTCPKAYPWFGNLLGTERNLKTVLELVQESNANEPQPSPANLNNSSNNNNGNNSNSNSPIQSGGK